MLRPADNTPAQKDTGISTKVVFLRQPSSYPEHPDEIGVIQTHMSWVFLLERFVYKLKKPVIFEFLDFSTLERRHHDCLEEVRLNRRFARDVYLSVVPLTQDASGRLHLDGDGEPVDWLVKMRRLPQESMLDQVIAARRVKEAEVQAVSKILARFYLRADPANITPPEYRRRFAQNIHAYTLALSETGYGLPQRQITTIEKTLQQFLSRRSKLFDARVNRRRIVEAHGDLRPEHICLIDPPAIIDCLEFNHTLRILDPADELAFLALECEYAGAPYIGQAVFDSYQQLTNDYPAHALVLFYKAFRAFLRAKLTIRHLDDHDARKHPKWVQRADDYLQLAQQYAGTLIGQEP